MQVPSMLQRESLTRLLQGATAGAVATIVVGFSWGGWSLSSTADKMAKEQSERAVVAALAPVCADKFRALPDAAAKTVALSKADSWNRAAEFPAEVCGFFRRGTRRLLRDSYGQVRGRFPVRRSENRAHQDKNESYEVSPEIIRHRP